MRFGYLFKEFSIDGSRTLMGVVFQSLKAESWILTEVLIVQFRGKDVSAIQKVGGGAPTSIVLPLNCFPSSSSRFYLSPVFLYF